MGDEDKALLKLLNLREALEPKKRNFNAKDVGIHQKDFNFSFPSLPNTFKQNSLSINN